MKLLRLYDAKKILFVIPIVRLLENDTNKMNIRRDSLFDSTQIYGHIHTHTQALSLHMIESMQYWMKKSLFLLLLFFSSLTENNHQSTQTAAIWRLINKNSIKSWDEKSTKETELILLTRVWNNEWWAEEEEKKTGIECEFHR